MQAQKTDLTSAENLEAVFFNFDVSGEKAAAISQKVSVGSSVEFRQFRSMDNATLTCLEPTHTNGLVSISWDHITEDQFGWYIVTRRNGSDEETFDSRAAENASNFWIENQGVVFTDNVGDPDQNGTYHYTIEAYAPFHNGLPIATAVRSITIDATLPGGSNVPPGPPSPDIPAPTPTPSSAPPATDDATPTLMLAVLMAASVAVYAFCALCRKMRTNG